jgi:hypothetical protein
MTKPYFLLSRNNGQISFRAIFAAIVLCVMISARHSGKRLVQRLIHSPVRQELRWRICQPETTTLVAANLDDNASAVTNIGFDFWFASVSKLSFQ